MELLETSLTATWPAETQMAAMGYYHDLEKIMMMFTTIMVKVMVMFTMMMKLTR